MEDGLVQTEAERQKAIQMGLNPCFNGRWSRTSDIIRNLEINEKS